MSVLWRLKFAEKEQIITWTYDYEGGAHIPNKKHLGYFYSRGLLRYYGDNYVRKLKK